jgi:hypothetical protein
MEKKKIGRAKGHTVTRSEVKKGVAAMSQAMTTRVAAKPKTASRMKMKS